MNEPFLTFTELPDGKCQVRCQLVYDDPFTYGMVIVDAMRTIALAYAEMDDASQHGPYLERIKLGLDAEFDSLTADIDFRKEHEV